MIKTLLFDFDGVLADSVGIKTDAFVEIFKGYPQYVPAIVDYQQTNGGISRMRKFKHIYEQILKRELTDAKLDELCDQFSALVKEKVIGSSFVNGAKELLDYCFGKYPLYVISGTPQEEMKDIVVQRKLAKYFAGIYGSPRSKAEIIQTILQAQRVKNEEAVFVGDSINDFQAAMDTGVRFIAKLGSDDGPWIEDKRIEYKCHDMVELRRYLGRGTS